MRVWLAAVVASAGGLALAWSVARHASAETRVDVIPSLGVSESWSDNVGLSGGESHSGFTTNVTPGLRLGATGGQLTGGAAYALNVRIEHFGEGETDLDHDASADLNYDATPRWRLFLREDFRLSPDPTRSLAFVTPGGEAFRRFEEAARQPGVDILDIRVLRARRDQLRNRVSVGTTYDLTPRWSVGADGIWLLQDSRDEIFGEDSRTLGGRLQASYRLTPTDDVSLSVGADVTDFERKPDATVLRAAAGWRRRLTPTIRLDLEGGYARVSTDGGASAAARDESAVSGRVALTGEQAQGRWRLSLAREIAVGDGSGDVSRRLVAEAGLGRALGRTVTGDLSLRYLRTRSVRDLGIEANVFEGIAAVSYQFIRWAAARAAYRYRRDEPPGGGSAVAENNVLVGIEVRWPVRELPGVRTAQSRRRTWRRSALPSASLT